MRATRMLSLSFVTISLALSSAPLFAAPGISVKAPTLYPEGIAYNPKSSELFLSSMRLGTVGAVKMDGTYREFAKDPQLVSSVGMHADPERNRLLVCVSDPGVSVATSPKTQKKIARLIAFDITSGKKLKVVELGKVGGAGEHFCNDIAIDDAGNAYVTDSFSPVIYKVDPKYKASVFLKSDSFKGEGFNLNGIVHHKDGYLLVAKSSDGTIFKIDEKDPKKMAAVDTPKLVNADGLVLTPEGDLIVIQNGDAKVTRLKTTDGWKTAKADKTMATEKAFPTTGVDAGGKIYVVISKLNELFADPSKAKSDTFTLELFQ